jgi:hypothetical protein
MLTALVLLPALLHVLSRPATEVKPVILSMPSAVGRRVAA